MKKNIMMIVCLFISYSNFAVSETSVTNHYGDTSIEKLVLINHITGATFTSITFTSILTNTKELMDFNSIKCFLYEPQTRYECALIGHGYRYIVAGYGSLGFRLEDGTEKKCKFRFNMYKDILVGSICEDELDYKLSSDLVREHHGFRPILGLYGIRNAIHDIPSEGNIISMLLFRPDLVSEGNSSHDIGDVLTSGDIGMILAEPIPGRYLSEELSKKKSRFLFVDPSESYKPLKLEKKLQVQIDPSMEEKLKLSDVEYSPYMLNGKASLRYNECKEEEGRIFKCSIPKTSIYYESVISSEKARGYQAPTIGASIKVKLTDQNDRSHSIECLFNYYNIRNKKTAQNIATGSICNQDSYMFSAYGISGNKIIISSTFRVKLN